MASNKNRRPGWQARHGGDYIDSSSVNVLAFRTKFQPSPFDRLTAQVVLAQFRAGTLPEAVMVALLGAVGLEVQQ